MNTEAVSALIVLVVSASAAGILLRCLPIRQAAARWLTFLVLWVILLIVPVQLCGALQLAGVIPRFQMWGLALLQAGLFAGASIIYRIVAADREPQPTAPVRSEGGLPAYLWTILLILAVSYGVFALDLLTSYPSGNDALGYHYLMSLRWLQEGSLRISSNAFPFNFPGNVEIGFMLLMATGIQSLVPAINWLGIAMLALSVYMIAQQLWKRREAAILGAVLVLTIPMIEFQTFSGYIDATGTAFLFAAVALWVHGRQLPQSVDERNRLPVAVLFLASLAAGLSIGSKPTFWFYSVFVFAIIVGALVRDRMLHGSRLAVPVAVVLLGFLLPSAFWFGRGIYLERNPLYPLQVAVAGHVLLPGTSAHDITPARATYRHVRRNAEWIIYPWTEYKQAPDYLLIPYSTGDGLGAAFATFVPLGMLFLLLRVLRRRATPAELGLLGLSVVLVVAWWLLMSRVLRYGLPIWVLACLGTVPMMGFLSQALQARWFRRLAVLSVASTCAISAFVPFHSLASRIRSGDWSRATFYSYPKMVDELPPGSVVLNRTSDTLQNFALAGRNLTNRVIGNIEGPAEITLQQLEQYHVHYVVTMADEPMQEAALRRLPGVTLVDSEVVQSGNSRKQWQIWKVH
jgi:hypothetical protein